LTWPSSRCASIGCAALLTLYASLDWLDGLQARRTGMHNHPAILLTDHGCDAFQVWLVTTVITSSLGIRSPWACFVILTASYTVFYFTIWESLMVSRLTFPSGLWNPTNGLVLIALILVLRGVLAPDSWSIERDIPRHLWVVCG
jgi:phosphatidylglycerophosphate synthase